ncbi:protein SPMIP2 [Ciona intestinalis]
MNTNMLLTRRESGAFDPITKRYLWPPGINATGRRMLFTGPDGITDQRVTVEEDNRYVGIGTMSPEGTSELAYLYRPDWRNSPAVLPKHKRVGEIGWGIPKYSDRSYLYTGRQIKRGEFRQSAEDRHTHLYQNPWTPKPQYNKTKRPRTAPVGSARFLGSNDEYLLETNFRRELESRETGNRSSSDTSSSSRSQVGHYDS